MDLSVAARPLPAAADPLRTAVSAFLLGFSSENTRRSYAGDLKAWLIFCADHDIAPFTARRAHIDAWARALEADGASARTVARRLSCLASFYGYLVDEGAASSSPVEHVRRPAIDPDDSPTLGLDKDQGRALLGAAHKFGSQRDVALIALLVTNGLRVEEALSRDVEHLGNERGHRTLRIRRKGGRERVAALPATVARVLDEYLDDRVDGPIFITKTGRRYDRPAAFRMLRRLAHKAEIDIADQLSLHSLRHTAITAALDAGQPLRDVQDFAGHADPRTTRRYDRRRHNLDRRSAYAVAAWFSDNGPPDRPTS